MKIRHRLSLLLLAFGLSCSKNDKVTPFSPTSNTQSPKHELVLNQFLGESISLEQAEQVLPMLSFTFTLILVGADLKTATTTAII